MVVCSNKIVISVQLLLCIDEHSRMYIHPIFAFSLSFFLLVWILFFSSVFIWYCPSVDDKDDTMNAAIYHLKDTYITSMSSNLKLLLEFVLGKRSYALAFTLYIWNNVISVLFLYCYRYIYIYIYISQPFSH